MASNDDSGQTRKTKKRKKKKNNSSLRRKKCKIKIFFKPNKKFSTYESLWVLSFVFIESLFLNLTMTSENVETCIFKRFYEIS